jgi:DNA-directed RNA polymerase subunit L
MSTNYDNTFIKFFEGFIKFISIYTILNNILIETYEHSLLALISAVLLNQDKVKIMTYPNH